MSAFAAIAISAENSRAETQDNYSDDNYPPNPFVPATESKSESSFICHDKSPSLGYNCLLYL